MKKKELLTYVCLGIALGMTIPADVFASKTSVYGLKRLLKLEII